MEKYITLEKEVGETPLSCAEAYRDKHPELDGVAMAYAGRLDPMASGSLLVLLGDECKNQTNYHSLDKEYEFSVLLGIGSDTHDVLGRLKLPKLGNLSDGNSISGRVNHGLAAPSALDDIELPSEKIKHLCNTLTGKIELPYPHFSAKTVQGKPLHMWTLENRLDEITIPTKESTVYSLDLVDIETKTRANVCAEARIKIDSIPEVTEARKALGNDFRRVDVRKDWENIAADDSLPNTYLIANFTCTASSGTYMRTLAKVIGGKLDTLGLAWRIHRTKIGTYDTDSQTWKNEF